MDKYSEFTYIWFYKNEIHSHISKKYKEQIISSTTDENYIFMIKPYSTHINFINGPLIFCNIVKIIEDKSYLDIFNTKLQYTYNEINIMKNLESILNNNHIKSNIEIGFNFKISRINYNIFMRFFGNIVEEVLTDINFVYIKMKKTDKLIEQCINAIFIRYYLQLIGQVKYYKYEKYNLLNGFKYFIDDKSLVGILLDNFNFKNGLKLSIKYNNIISEKDKKILQTTYNIYYETLVNNKSLAKFIFNKEIIENINISDNNKYFTNDFVDNKILEFDDDRCNLYCNPFALLTYHISITELYENNLLLNNIVKLYNETFEKINNYFYDEENNLYFGKHQFLLNIIRENKIKTEYGTNLLIDKKEEENLVLINYFYKNILNNLDAYNNSESNINNLELICKILNNINNVFKPKNMIELTTIIDDIAEIIKNENIFSNIFAVSKSINFINDYNFEIILLNNSYIENIILDDLIYLYNNKHYIKKNQIQTNLIDIIKDISYSMDKYLITDELKAVLNNIIINVKGNQDINNNLENVIEILKKNKIEEVIDTLSDFEGLEEQEEDIYDNDVFKNDNENQKTENSYYISKWLF